MSKPNSLPTIGFVGTGAITTAVVTGFCERAKEFPFPIVISPRNKENAEKLKRAYSDRITIAKDSQDVLDRSEWVVLAVLPQVGEGICRSLRFRSDHKVISFFPDKALAQVRSWIGDTAELVHMLPLTFNAFADGPIILCPPQKEVAEIFGHIGKVVEMERSDEAAVLSVVTACVTPMFAVMETLIQWISAKGIPEDIATNYTTNFFLAVCQEAVRLDRYGVHTMATVSTPGGLNLMAKDIIEKLGGFDAWQAAMLPVLQRMTENFPHEA